MESAFRIAVLEAFEQLLTQLGALEKALIADNNLMAWVNGFPTEKWSFVQAREKAFSAISQLEYTPDQDPRSILLCPGFIGASQDTLEVVKSVNQAKQNFKTAMVALRSLKAKAAKETAFNAQIDTLLNRRDPYCAQLMRKMGLARLHLKQCYRLLPILPAPPQKLRWTWANTRAIQKITAEKAYERLSKRQNNPAVALQLEKLSTLNPQEPLAIVQELAPHLRVNVVFKGYDEAPDRLMVKGPVPLFFEANAQSKLPDFKPPPEKQGKNNARPVRSDVRIDPDPFLPAIRAHRYLVKS